MTQEYNIKRISIEKATVGMILAKDILNDAGMILMSEGTELSEKHIIKLQLYHINSISIKEMISVEYTRKQQPQNYTDEAKHITQQKAFQSFQSTYNDQKNSIRNQMLDISDGKVADVKELFSVSSNIMNALKYKSDLFNFLHHLQSVDDFTYTHCINVSLLCNLFGQWLKYPNDDLEMLTVSGLLHDIGKIKIDPTVLNKPDKLTPNEFEEIKKHPIYGFRMIEKQNISQDIKMAVLMHHEKYDGSGYPMGAKDQQINKYAKIVAIADIYDAMTSNRSYRDKFCPFEVIRRFEQEYYGKLDTKFLMTFLQNIAQNYVGSWVRLSTGEEGEIIFINKYFLSKPIIRIDNSMVDLSQEEEVYIESII